MYDVIFIDAYGHEIPLAMDLDDRQAAVELARKIAAERHVGRMMLPGSSKPPNCVCVIPTASKAAA